MPGVIKPLNTYRIYYDNANGIRPGAPVLLAAGKSVKSRPSNPRCLWIAADRTS